jgi:hypothetical protein
MNRILNQACFRFSALAVVGVAAGLIATASPPGLAQAPQQPSDISPTISSDQAGTPPRFGVPDFIALSNDAETVDAAQTVGRVLWDDLNFEHEFALIPRDVYSSIPPRPRSPTRRWIAGAK